MADNYPFDSDNVPYSAVFNQDYTADSALDVSTETAQTSAVSLITIEGGAGGTSAGVGGTGGSVTTLDTTYSASRGSYSGGDGGTGGGALGNGAGGGGAAGYAGNGANAGAAAAANSGAGGGGGASTDRVLYGGGGVGIFGLTGDDGTAGNGSTATAAGGGSTFNSIIGDEHLEKVKLLLRGGSDTPRNLGNPESFAITRYGSTTGASRFVTGKYGKAFDFNGTDDYLELTGGDLSGGDWTIEMWINFDTIAAFRGPIFTNRDRVGTSNANDPGEWHFQVRESSAPYYMSFALMDTPNATIVVTNSNSAISAGTWHHVALSYVASTYTIYVAVDGTVTSSTNSTKYPGISLGADDELQIAKSRNNTAFYDGQIDDIRFTKGAARYTSSYTVPAAAHPIIHAKSGNNGFKDSAGTQVDYA